LDCETIEYSIRGDKGCYNIQIDPFLTIKTGLRYLTTTAHFGFNTFKPICNLIVK